MKMSLQIAAILCLMMNRQNYFLGKKILCLRMIKGKSPKKFKTNVVSTVLRKERLKL